MHLHFEALTVEPVGPFHIGRKAGFTVEYIGLFHFRLYRVLSKELVRLSFGSSYLDRLEKVQVIGAGTQALLYLL